MFGCNPVFGYQTWDSFIKENSTAEPLLKEAFQPVGGSVVLSEPGPNFIYKRPDDDDVRDVKRYTLEEMEEMFENYGEILIV